MSLARNVSALSTTAECVSGVVSAAVTRESECPGFPESKVAQVTDDDEELVRLRADAEQVGIVDSSKLSVEQLRRALADRRRGLDPKQAEQEATGEQH
ncbi:hypothetical protein KIPE111705_15040 [Kibdelosporangium persicum]